MTWRHALPLFFADNCSRLTSWYIIKAFRMRELARSLCEDVQHLSRLLRQVATMLRLATLSLLAVLAAVSASPRPSPTPCTLKASGGDDAPALLRALRTCPRVTIPKSQTLSIRSLVNATGLRDVHLRLEGAIKYWDDVDYWVENAFAFGESIGGDGDREEPRMNRRY